MRRLATIALLGGLALLTTGASQASAHAGFVSSTPSNGDVIPASPTEITLTFTETPDPAVSSVRITDTGGAERETGPPRVDGPVLTVPVDEVLPDGVYTVSWRVVSTEDGHVTAGGFAFGVGDAAPPTGGGGAAVEPVGPTALSVTSKAALYIGLMLLVAVAVVGLGAFGGQPRSIGAIAVGSGALAFAGSIGILVAEQQAVGVAMADLVASETGRPFLWLVGACLAAAGLAVLGAARARWRPVLWVAGATAAAGMFARTTTGHPAAAEVPLLAETLQWIHFMAAGLWVGGLVLLVVVLREGGDPPVAAVRRFSSLAIVAVAVVVATGIVRAIGQLGGVAVLGDALGQRYGQVLLAKVALAVVLIALGARNRRRSIPRLAEGDPAGLRRLAGAEVVVALGVVFATATLTGLSPLDTDAAPAGPSTTDRTTVAGADFATTTRVSLTVTPGTPGPNVFRAVVTDYDSGDPIDADTVSLDLRSATRPEIAPSTVTLAADADAWVGQGVDLSVSGTWALTARVVNGADAVEVPLAFITVSRGAVPAGGTTFGTTTFPEGVSMALHLDPGAPGENVLHVDLVAPDGSPLAPGEVVVVATPDGGEPLRFAPVASEGRVTLAIPLTLETGTWTIDAVASTPDGRSFQATLFAVPIAGA